MSAKITQLFSQVQNIPQVPEVIRVLITQFNDPNIDMKDIARNVEKEQVIALKVLRLVNSAHFGLPKKVASIEDAVVMLGMAQLRTLVVASGIVSAVPEMDGFDIKQFWQDSFRTASYAKWFANEINDDADIAFTAGLISNLGRVLIHLGLKKEAIDIEQRISEQHSRMLLEKARLGFTSQDVSAELCRLWKFSDDLVIPVSQCGEPLSAEPVSKIACVIFLARYLSQCKKAELTEDEILQHLPAEVAEQINFSAAAMKDKLMDILALESGLDGLLD